MNSGLHIVGLCGSTRNQSYNHMLLENFVQGLPEGTTYSEGVLTTLPFYNQDVEQNPPESVTTLKELVQSADGLIISAPEYNFSYPAILKNAIEWLSRPAAGRALAGKHIALLGASTGNFGPARGHMHLRQVLFSVEALPVQRPEVFVSNAASKFDANGTLTDPAAKDFLQQLMNNFIASIAK